MKRNIVIKKIEGPSVAEREIEIVERKGVGHPDYLCDFVCEVSSQVLSQYYLKRFGKVLHHNLDKGLLVAGRSQPQFGGGKILEPIKIIVAGRAVDRVKGFKIPVEKITKRAIENGLSKILNQKKSFIERNFKISIDYKAGAANLQEVFKRGEKVAIANDTSFGVAHGPLSQTEILTLKVANFINSENFSKRFPFVGKDIKVMALRERKGISLTLAIAFIDRFIKSVREYFENKKRIKREIERYLQRNFEFKSTKIEINVLDDPEAESEEGIYLTCLGLSAEQGDDGQVGRGNRVCGLITPCRQMSMEAAAGKNINHPGKLYQILAYLIAQRIGKLKEVKECQVKLLSEIGKPLDCPKIALIELKTKDFPKIKKKASLICQNYLDKLKKIQREIIEGKYSLF